MNMDMERTMDDDVREAGLDDEDIQHMGRALLGFSIQIGWAGIIFSMARIAVETGDHTVAKLMIAAYQSLYGMEPPLDSDDMDGFCEVIREKVAETSWEAMLSLASYAAAGEVRGQTFESESLVLTTAWNALHQLKDFTPEFLTSSSMN